MHQNHETVWHICLINMKSCFQLHLLDWNFIPLHILSHHVSLTARLTGANKNFQKFSGVRSTDGFSTGEASQKPGRKCQRNVKNVKEMSKMSKNPKNWWTFTEIANIDRETLYIFWTTWGISTKFSGILGSDDLTILFSP